MRQRPDIVFRMLTKRAHRISEFVKDGRTYRIPDKRTQSLQAFKSGLSHQGRPIDFRLTNPEPDLIVECIRQKARHKSEAVKIVSYHKYPQLPQTHQMAREVMVEVRDKGHENRE